MAKSIQPWPGEVRVLFACGALGLAIGGLCALLALGHGTAEVPPAGNLFKPMTFDSALGLYFLTLAALLPAAGLTPRGRRRFARLSVGEALVSYGIETVQTLRGVDPRFPASGALADAIVSGAFALTSAALLATFIGLLWASFRSTSNRPFLNLGLRYGGVAALIAYAVGITMVIYRGRYAGEAGNLLIPHAFGFHGLQAVPLAAWLAPRSAPTERAARGVVHACGSAWALACLLLLLHTLQGHAVTEATPALVAAAALCLISVAVLGYGLYARFKRGRTGHRSLPEAP